MLSLHTASLDKSTHAAVPPKLHRSFVSMLAFSLYVFLLTQAHAAPLGSNVGFTVIPEPEDGSAIPYPLDTAIQDAERWANFWNELHPGIPAPYIKFDRHMVVAVALGGGTPSSEIKVTSITRRSVADLKPLIEVHITETRPGRGCVLPAVFMPPPHMLVRTETGQDVTFRRRSVYRHCRGLLSIEMSKR